MSDQIFSMFSIYVEDRGRPSSTTILWQKKDPKLVGDKEKAITFICLPPFFPTLIKGEFLH